MMRFIIIGISDNPQPFFPPEVLEIIKKGRVFSGGKRHHEMVAPLLPADATWIDITVPLANVFEQYKNISLRLSSKDMEVHKTTAYEGDYSPLYGRGAGGEALIVFASGDPLFFGFANTLKREFPEAELTLFPSFNSLQMLAHRLVLPYHDLRIVSLTGRPWQEFDKALIEHASKIGVLTDREHTPAAIARRMLEYGYKDYAMHVGEHLGNPQKEKVSTLTLQEAVKREFQMPNCIIFTSSIIEGSSGAERRAYGIPDTAFTLLNGREKMITKMPIRLLTLQAIDLPRRHVLWDIGACTGSVSIEARLLFPHLQIEAFEIRPECETIIQANVHRFGAPGIGIHIGDFLVSCDSVAAHSRPDAVFIGGHGGRLKEIMQKVLTLLAPGGVIVMNSVKAPKVTADSHRLWDEACAELGLQQEPPLYIQLNDHHPITILKCKLPS